MAKKEKVYINRGHDNTDPGAVGYVVEREQNVDVGDFVEEYLKENYECSIKGNKGTVGSLTTICNEANKWGADLFVSIHFNAGGGDGHEVLVYDKNNLALGKVFDKHLKAIGQNSRGVKYRPDLGVLRLTNMKAVLVECAFVDNWKDIKDWNESAELKKMGEAIAKAIAEFLDLPEKTKKKTLKKGAKCKIKVGAKDLNTGKKYSSWVYLNTYEVISINGNRVVFGKNGAVTGATNKSNIKL